MKVRASALAVALLAGACGGDDGAGSDTTTTAPSETTATTTTEGTATTSEDTGTTETTATTTTPPAPSDGVTWSRISHDDALFGGEDDQIMRGVTAGGPGLVAVGEDWGVVVQPVAAVWTSSDGFTWSRVPHDEAIFGGDGTQAMLSVTTGGPGFVAVGLDSHLADRDAAVWTSTDGSTWSRLPHDEAAFGGEDGPAMFSVTVGGPGLVAVGWTGFEERDAAVWTSSDGITWSRVPHDESVFGGDGHQEMYGVTAGGPGLVAVGREGDVFLDDRNAAVWTSVDGITWSRVPHDEEVFGPGDDWREMVSVTAGGPGVVAVGSAEVWTSPEGISWSRLPRDEAILSGVMLSVIATDAGLVGVGSDGDAAVAWTSADGITWSRVAHDEAVFGGEGTQQMLSVAAGGPGLVAVGSDGPAGSLAAAVWVGTAEG